MNPFRKPVLRTSHIWLPGYCKARLANRGGPPIKRIWLMIADHFEPWWRQADDHTALERVRRWSRQWPAIAARHVDSAGRPACYTFFYPEEQYQPTVMDQLAQLREAGTADVEVHLHHDRESEQHFVDRMGTFIERLSNRHDLLHRHGRRIAFGFIHGNWALDNSLDDGRFCGLNNEITLLRDLGCYADFTLPSAPSPAQTRMVNTIYWAVDDPQLPKSHDTGVPVTAGGAVAGDLLMIPGPLALNLRDQGQRGVPWLECGELAGHCRPTPHRARLWTRVAPRLGPDLFIKLFTHGAPEKNAGPLLDVAGVLDRTFDIVTREAARLQAEIFFVSAWQMWSAVDAIRRGEDPRLTIELDESARRVSCETSSS